MGISQGLKQLGIDFASTSTTAEHALGTRVVSTTGAVYTYIIAGGTIAVGDALVRSTSGTGVPHRLVASSALNQPLAGVAPVAIASGSYGWVITQGPATVKVAASTAAGTAVGTSATAATLTALVASSTVSQAEAQRAIAAASGVGAVTTAAEASGTAAVWLS